MIGLGVRGVREGRVLRWLRLRVLLFDDERSNVVPGFLVVFSVGTIAVRELQGRGETTTEFTLISHMKRVC